MSYEAEEMPAVFTEPEEPLAPAASSRLRQRITEEASQDSPAG
jgi:hypothetical protein